MSSAHALPSPAHVSERVAAYPWLEIASALDDTGYALLPGLLARAECAQLIAQYERAELFRSRVVMHQHGYGRGEYQYFARPLPELVASLRETLYAHIVPIANAWAQRLGKTTFPPTLPELSQLCAALGQGRPTPLLLKYGPGDYNRLHQDLYGELVFPVQVAVLLSAPTSDFSGGELVLTEQRARMQSRASVVPLERGDAVIFPVSERPVAGVRSDTRVKMRHGVSSIRSGARYTLGLIFHDAT